MTNSTPISLETSPIGGGDDGGSDGGNAPHDKEEAVIQGFDKDRASSSQSLKIPVDEEHHCSEDCSTRAGSLTDEAGEARTSGGSTNTAGTNGMPPSGEMDSSLAEVDGLAVSQGVFSTEKGSTVNDPATWPSHHHDLQPAGAGDDSGIVARVSLHGSLS